MGNNVSQETSRKSLDHVINYIAARYIRSQNFQDMKNLSNLEYCDNLVILTSKIISKYLDESNIKYLSQKKGIDGEKIVRDKVLAINKNTLDNLDEKNTSKKRRLCIGLAKHYVQVANIFSAIASTINPTYSFKDEDGKETTIGLEERDDVPEDTTPTIHKNNLCSKRVAVLLNHQDIKSFEEDINKGNIKLKPDFCSFNCSTCPSSKDLGQEPGIPELETLYYDKYDYDTGNYNGMTETMAKLYKADVDELYKIFTGNNSVPETVNKFSDIKLKNYYTTSGCENGQYNTSVEGKPSNYLFYEYVQNIKNMLASTKKYHNQLLDILDQLFSFGINPETNYKTVVLNPELTDVLLKTLTQKTIIIITNLYASCERRFAKGVEIYTSIANKQLLRTSKFQIEHLNALQNTLDNNEEPPLEPSPDEASTGEASPVEASSAEQSPVEASSAEQSPVEASSIEASPGEASPVEPSSAEQSSVEASPVEASSVEASSVEASSVEASPVEASSVETSPVEASPVEASPVEASPVEASPVETSPVEASPVEASSVETSPVEASDVEQSAAEQSPVEGTYNEKLDEIIENLEEAREEERRALKELDELKIKKTESTKTATPSPEVNVKLDNRIVSKTPDTEKIGSLFQNKLDINGSIKDSSKTASPSPEVKQNEEKLLLPKSL